MSCSEAVFTFIWEIDNLNFYFRDESIRSPAFEVDILENTKWSLELFTYRKQYEHKISLDLSYESGLTNRQLSIEIDYELSLTSADGSVKTWNKFQGKFGEHLLPASVFDLPASVSFDEVVKGKKHDIFFRENLIVRCRMWRRGAEAKNGKLCFARTRISYEKRIFTWVLHEFDTLQPQEKRSIRVRSSSKSLPALDLIFYLYDGEIQIEISPSGQPTNKRFKSLCFLYVVDNEGKPAMSLIADHEFRGAPVSKEVRQFPTFLTKSKLIASKRRYLPNNALSIRCECALSAGVCSNQIEDYRQYYDTSVDAVVMGGDECQADMCDLKDEGLEKLFLDEEFCNMYIKVGHRKFPVHTFILSDISSVFEDIFKSKAEEICSDCLEISDLDEDTVWRLLKYIYTNSVGDLSHEGAIKLYNAAVKYEIVPLRRLCSDLLKIKLGMSNWCAILNLSLLHQDVDLKCVVIQFMTAHDSEIFQSEEWKVLEKTHPKSAYQTICDMYRYLKKTLWK